MLRETTTATTTAWDRRAGRWGLCCRRVESPRSPRASAAKLTPCPGQFPPTEASSRPLAACIAPPCARPSYPGAHPGWRGYLWCRTGCRSRSTPTASLARTMSRFPPEARRRARDVGAGRVAVGVACALASGLPGARATSRTPWVRGTRSGGLAQLDSVRPNMLGRRLTLEVGGVMCEDARASYGGPGLTPDARLLRSSFVVPVAAGGCPGLIHRCPANGPARVPVVLPAVSWPWPPCWPRCWARLCHGLCHGLCHRLCHVGVRFVCLCVFPCCVSLLCCLRSCSLSCHLSFSLSLSLG